LNETITETNVDQSTEKKAFGFNPFRFFATGADKALIKSREQIDSIFKRTQIATMFAITFGYGSYYTCRLALSVVKKPLIDAGIFTPEQLGVIGSAIFYGYAMGKMTNGFLADHANIKRLFTFGLLCSAIINLVMGSMSGFWLFVILWGINGWFQAFGAPSSMVAMVHWFSNHERGRRYGVWSASHSIGEGLTFAGTATLVSYWGWRAGFLAPAVFCILISIIVFILLKDRPRTLGLPTVAEWKNDHGMPVDHNRSTLSIQKQIFKRPALWILACASACMYVTRYGIDNWGILYLQETRGCSLIQAGSMLSFNTLAGIFGSIAYGYISDKLFKARRPPVTLIFGLIQIVTLCAIFYAPIVNKQLLTAVFIIYGFAFSGLLAAIGLFAVDIMPKRAAGAVGGVMGIVSYCFAGIQDRISGALIGSNVHIIDGIKHYDFSHAVIFWIGASILSMILAASLWRVQMAD